MEEKMTYEDLVELMNKIYESMGMSRDKAKDIEEKKAALVEEKSVLKVAMGKEELEKLGLEKKEFDEMTVAALERAVVNTDRIRQEIQAEYNNFYVRSKENELKVQEENKKIAEKEQERDSKIQAVNEKLQKFVQGKNLKEEVLNRLQSSAAKQIEEINKEFEGVKEESKKTIEEMNKKLISSQETQKENLDNVNKYEKEIMEYAAELGAEDKIKQALQKAASKEIFEQKEAKKEEKVEEKEAEKVEYAPRTIYSVNSNAEQEQTVEPEKTENKEEEKEETEKAEEEKAEENPKTFAEKHPRLAKIPFIASIMKKMDGKEEREQDFIDAYMVEYGTEPSGFEKFLARHPKIKSIVNKVTRGKYEIKETTDVKELTAKKEKYEAAGKTELAELVAEKIASIEEKSLKAQKDSFYKRVEVPAPENEEPAEEVANGLENEFEAGEKEAENAENENKEEEAEIGE